VSRVSYQAILDGPVGSDPGFVPLPRAAFVSRRKDATTTVRVALTPRQRRWLEGTATQGGVDADATIRAAVDVLGALNIDWAAISSPGELRRALAEAIRIRQAR
jgi:hypothetical protein